MRAAVLQNPGEPLAVVDLDDPTPGEDEVVLAVDACGICGSDLHAADALPLPGLVMGHEFCGTIAEVGPGVEGWAVGDRAAALSLVTCGRCPACLSGRVRKCPTAQMVGIERPGGFAEYVTMTARDLHRLPAAVDASLGALVEPMAVALHTVHRTGIRVGEDALVIGGGPIGAAVALWLRQAGAREVVVSDPVAHRRELAESVGATATIDPVAQDVAAAAVEVCGALPRHVVECVGVPGVIQHAADVAPVDGVVTVAGVCIPPDEIVPFTLMSKELDVRFAFYYTRTEFDAVIDLLARGRVDVTPLITDRVDLDGLPAAFDALRHPTEQCKVLIRP